MDSWKTIVRIGTAVLRRRKLLALLVMLIALAGLLPSAHYLARERPRYTSTAVVFVEVRPSRLFQDYAPYRPIGVQLAILQSRSLAEAVLERLPGDAAQDLKRSLSSPSPLEIIQSRVLGSSRVPSAPLADPRALLLNELQRRVHSVSTRDGIVTISTQASTPQIATSLANTYSDALVARSQTFRRDDGRVSRAFLEQQLTDVRKSLQAGEERLQRLLAQHGGIAVPERNRATVEELAATERSLAEIEVNRKMLATRLEALREKITTSKPAPPATRTPSVPPSPSPDVQRLRNELARLETSLLELRGRYTDEHPRVIRTREQLAEYHRDLARAVKEGTAATPAAGMVPQAERAPFAEQVLTLETAFHTVVAQEDALRSQGARLRQNLAGLSQDVNDYARVVREVERDRNLATVLADKLATARIAEQGDIDTVKIIDPATRAVPAASTKRLAFLAAALTGAVVVGIGVPAGVEWIRRTVDNEDDAVEATGLPVLASLPSLPTRQPAFVSDVHTSRAPLNADFVFTEAFHTLRVAVQLTMRSENLRTLLVTSALPNEGKSTVVLNLAHALREAGQTVVVADTDFQRPTLHRTLDTVPSTGFIDALDGPSTDLEASLVPVHQSMWLLPCGSSISPSTREALTTDRVKILLGQLSTHAKLVLCDSSPVLVVPEALFLASAVDATLLVAKAGSTRRHDLARAKAILEGAGARVIGVVLNEMPLSTLRHYHHRYYYSRHDARATSSANAS